ncbi:androgen-dependent TFPI-regulating protein-like [Aricia agestis]|uniref:androgen-dependent TFPI-regulating protein-like n=1 Tax=Aricia agestis TaxID=91739 RepID=UPI001C209E78|nr:androgen-dependent TFPI-regulating protein-like [Aricia agestis]
MARETNGIYMRMGMYVLTIALHVTNIAYMATKTARSLEAAEDPYIKVYASLQTRFFTCWTFFLQIVYAVISLTCDSLLLKNSLKKNYKLPKYLYIFREGLFSSVIWPSIWVVFLVFWVLYHYNRDLIYPPFVDKILTSFSNHIMHTFIIPIATWDLLFRPRKVPKSHLPNLQYLTFHFGLYLAVLLYTYAETGIWIYPVFKSLYGTVYFIVALGIIFSIALGAYFIQWPITRTLFPETRKKVK